MLQYTNRAGKKAQALILKSQLKFRIVLVACLAIQQIQLHVGGSISIFAMTNIYYSKMVEKKISPAVLSTNGGDSSEHNTVLSDIAKQTRTNVCQFAQYSIKRPQTRRAMGTYGSTCIRVFWPSRLLDSTGVMSKSQVVKYTSHSHRETEHMS